MKVTNTLGLPEVLVKVASNQRKPKLGSISCTELIDSPLIRKLKLQHWDALEVDVSETIKSMLGTALHAHIEKHAGIEEAEVSLEKEFHNWLVTGTSDYMKNGVLSDWKTTSVWSVILNDSWIKKVEQQLQVYAWLWNQRGTQVRDLECVAIFTDWRRSEALRNENYPRQNIMSIHFDVWPAEKTEQYIAERLDYHNDENYVCSLEERWARPEQFAVMKEGRKTAVRVFDNQLDAVNLVMDLGRGHKVEHRLGEHVRCQEYCPVRNVCKSRVM